MSNKKGVFRLASCELTIYLEDAQQESWWQGLSREEYNQLHQVDTAVEVWNDHQPKNHKPWEGSYQIWKQPRR